MNKYQVQIKAFIYVLIALCPLILKAQNVSLKRHWDSDYRNVRVVSYNILNGFDWGKDKDREARFINWVKDVKPDILALQELCGFTEDSLLKLGKSWGHSYAAIVKENGYPVGITSNRPIEVKNKILENVGHGLLHVETYGYQILVTHLNPSNLTKRELEAETISNYVSSLNTEKYILMGDMNSHSPADADYLETHAVNLISNYGGLTSTNLRGGELDYAVAAKFLSFPMIDICRKFVAPEKRTTFPTPILMTVSTNPDIRKRSNERIDFIFISPEMSKSVTDAFIFNEGVTDYISDHYPIGMDLIVKKTQDH